MKLFKQTVIVQLIIATMTAFAQEYPQDLTTIYTSESVWIKTIKSIDENAFLAFGGTDAGSRVLMKMTYDGEILDSIGLPNNRLEYWGQGDFMNGKFRYVSFRADDNDTLPLLCVVDVDPNDLSLTYTGYNWEGLDFDHPSITTYYRNQIYSVFSNDGGLILSYPVDSLWMINQMESMHIVKFNDQGNVVKERIFPDLRVTLANFLFSSPDSLGCRIILGNPGEGYSFDCHILDEDLNTVSVVEQAGMIYYPPASRWLYSISEAPTEISLNSNNGRTYSISSETPAGEKSNSDVIMASFDEDFNLIHWNWGVANPEGNDEGFGMCFGANGEIYMLGWMDVRPSFKNELEERRNDRVKDMDFYNLYVGYMDENLNKLSEIYFKPDGYYLGPLDIAVCPDGGCIVCSNRFKTTGYVDYCIFRITPEDFLDVEEAHLHGFTVATAYPNPGKDALNIRTGLRDAWVEVYDMNGRLMHRQDITENVTEIDARDWAESVYVWKVITSGVSTGSTTLAETGKWIKE
ncbi:MAG: T9SS type A sorting domain-containing protein [bacterium]|nr:T9SS type A sorting domain-containing protein [bacterium]